MAWDDPGVLICEALCAHHPAACLPAACKFNRTSRSPPPPPLLQVWTVAEVADRPGGTIYATGRALYVTPRAAVEAQPAAAVAGAGAPPAQPQQ